MLFEREQRSIRTELFWTSALHGRYPALAVSYHRWYWPEVLHYVYLDSARIK